MILTGNLKEYHDSKMNLKENAMGEMRAEGKSGKLSVPGALDGVCSAGIGPRVTAQMIELAIALVVYLLALGTFLPSLAHDDGSFSVPSLLLLLIYCTGQLYMIATRGQTYGRLIAGLRIVRFSDGKPGGRPALLKLIIEAALAGFTAGIALFLVFILSQDKANRHWVDRAYGVITINIRQGRDTAITPLAGEVMSVESVTSEATVSETTVSEPTASEPDDWERVSANTVETVSEFNSFIEEVPWKKDTSGPQTVNEATLEEPPSPPEGKALQETVKRWSSSSQQVKPEVDSNPVSLKNRPIKLTFDDGVAYLLQADTVIGRDPQAGNQHVFAKTLQIVDPAMSVSKTHMALSLKAGAVLVEDLYSTNGTWVVTPFGNPIAVLPEAPFLAMVGSTIHFGDRTVRVGD